MIVYFADRSMKLLGKASTDLDSGFTITSDNLTRDLETGVTTLDLTISFELKNQNKLEDITYAGNYILYSNGSGKANKRWRGFYTIIDSEISTGKQEVQIYAEDAGLDLINEIVGPYTATEAKSLKWYIQHFIQDSGFTVRYSEYDETTTKKLSWDDNATASERIVDVAKKFKAELGYSFKIEGFDIIKKYVDIYEDRGTDTAVQLRLGYEIDDIRIKRSVADLVTAIKVQGCRESDFEQTYEIVPQADRTGSPKEKEYYVLNKDRKYSKTSDKTFKNIDYYREKFPPKRGKNEEAKYITFSYPTQMSWADGQGDYIIHGTQMCSRKANAKWSRYKYKDEPNQGENSEGYIVGFFEYTDSEKYKKPGNGEDDYIQGFRKKMREEAVKELKKRCKETITYEAEILELPESLDLGDRVYVIDDNGHWYLQARLIELQFSASEDKLTCTLGDFKKKSSGIDDKILKLAENFEQIANARSLYTWIVYADDEEGGGVSLDPTGKKYIGVATGRFEPTPDLEDLSPYDWSLYVGADGADGESPTITTHHDDTNHQMVIYSVIGSAEPVIIGYIPDAEDGHTPIITTTKANGVTTIYADNVAIGSVNDGSSVSIVSSTKSGDTTTVVIHDSTGDHTLTIVDGQDGANGQPGTPGADGRTTYVHTAWCNSLAPTYDGFSTTDSSNKLYFGVYSDFVITDSTTPGDYNWSLIKGQDGKGIVSTVITYGISTSGTDSSQVTWQSQPDVIPDVPQGKYLWTRTAITYTDQTVKNTYSVAYKAANGINGQDAKNITTVTTQWCILPEGSEPTDQTEFYNAPPSYELGKKYWRRDYIEFTDHTIATSIPVIDNSLNDAMEAAMAAIVSDVKQYCVASSDEECKIYTYSEFTGTTFESDTLYFEKVNSLLSSEDVEGDPLPYDSTATYAVDALVLRDDRIYKCIEAIITPEEFNESKWTAVVYYIYIPTADNSKVAGKIYYYVSNKTEPTWYNDSIYNVITNDSKNFFENNYIWSRNKITYGSGRIEYLNLTVEPISNLFTRNITFDAGINELDDRINLTAESISTVSEKFDPVEERIATIENNAILSVEPGAITGTISEYVASKVGEGIENSGLNEVQEQLRSVTAQLSTNGFTVSKSDQGTSSLIDGEGLKVIKKVDGQDVIVAQFTNDDSEVDYLEVRRFLTFGAHRAETVQMLEWDGSTSTLGTGFFYNGVNNQNGSN